MQIETRYVPLRVWMWCAHHLGKVNHDRFSSLSCNKNIEFIEISMYKPRSSKPNDNVHEWWVQMARIRMVVDLPSVTTSEKKAQKAYEERTVDTRRSFPSQYNVGLDRLVLVLGSHARTEPSYTCQKDRGSMVWLNHLHKSPLFLRCQSGHVHPRSGLSFTKIISLIFDCPEWDPP